MISFPLSLYQAIRLLAATVNKNSVSQNLCETTVCSKLFTVPAPKEAGLSFAMGVLRSLQYQPFGVTRVDTEYDVLTSFVPRTAHKHRTARSDSIPPSLLLSGITSTPALQTSMSGVPRLKPSSRTAHSAFWIGTERLSSYEENHCATRRLYQVSSS